MTQTKPHLHKYIKHPHKHAHKQTQTNTHTQKQTRAHTHTNKHTQTRARTHAHKRIRTPCVARADAGGDACILLRVLTGDDGVDHGFARGILEPLDADRCCCSSPCPSRCCCRGLCWCLRCCCDTDELPDCGERSRGEWLRAGGLTAPRAIAWWRGLRRPRAESAVAGRAGMVVLLLVVVVVLLVVEAAVSARTCVRTAGECERIGNDEWHK